MTEEGEGRLARWSRLKRLHDGGERSRPSVAPEQRAAGTGSAPAREREPPTTEEAAQPDTTAPALPLIAELDKDSDFTPFLRAGVPERTHREALRALWRSDPVFAYRDGLTDYDEDYTAIGMVEQVVRTADQAGQGYLEAPGETTAEDGQPDDAGEAGQAADAADALSPVTTASEAPSAQSGPIESTQSANGTAEEPADLSSASSRVGNIRRS